MARIGHKLSRWVNPVLPSAASSSSGPPAMQQNATKCNTFSLLALFPASKPQPVQENVRPQALQRPIQEAPLSPRPRRTCLRTSPNFQRTAWTASQRSSSQRSQVIPDDDNYTYVWFHVKRQKRFFPSARPPSDGRLPGPTAETGACPPDRPVRRANGSAGENGRFSREDRIGPHVPSPRGRGLGWGRGTKSQVSSTKLQTN